MLDKGAHQEEGSIGSIIISNLFKGRKRRRAFFCPFLCEEHFSLREKG
nr:MAG TPA: hypothetical protein [Caudoviricetes sp.]